MIAFKLIFHWVGRTNMVSCQWPADCCGRHCTLSMFLVLGQILTCGCSWRMRELAVLSKDLLWRRSAWRLKKCCKPIELEWWQPFYVIALTMGTPFLHPSRWTCHCRTLYASGFLILINNSAMLEADVPKMSSSGWQDGKICLWNFRDINSLPVCS